ncbi:alkaline phosphatase [Micrococcus sp.]|uniref:choice-of-anchor I domain-containing protein n=1 Tax=Micrococcus sp. TaxID=1271 RepID=UPI0026DD1597|nr:alkaline phosphatase [Micrococcus sp.]MDO4240798.1 alkaline phosphatase [Micrococcus sp.]
MEDTAITHLQEDPTSRSTLSRLARLGAATSAAVLAPLAVSAPAERAAANPSGKTVGLTAAGTHETGVFDASAAEIPAFDPATGRLFVVNAQKGAIDVLRVCADAAPTGETVLSAEGLTTADGSVTDEGATVNSVAVSPNGAYAVVANEGEPADDFSADPEGTVSVISVPQNVHQFSRLSQDDVRTVDFRAYDAGTPLPEGVRVFGPDVQVPEGQEPAGRIARNLEPEYVTIGDTGRTAYVSVQEANAVVAIDLTSATIQDFWALQLTDWSKDGRLDASNDDGAINRQNWPVTGVPMPDGVDSYRWRGQDLVVTANEGDPREWGDVVDAERVKDLELCAAEYPEAAALQMKAALGRLNVVTDLGYDAERECYSRLHAFGGRSFSIYTADGELLFDSAGMIEDQIARLIAAGELPESALNANNDETPSFVPAHVSPSGEALLIVANEVSGSTTVYEVQPTRAR